MRFRVEFTTDSPGISRILIRSIRPSVFSLIAVIWVNAVLSVLMTTILQWLPRFAEWKPVEFNEWKTPYELSLTILISVPVILGIFGREYVSIRIDPLYPLVHFRLRFLEFSWEARENENANSRRDGSDPTTSYKTTVQVPQLRDKALPKLPNVQSATPSAWSDDLMSLSPSSMPWLGEEFLFNNDPPTTPGAEVTGPRRSSSSRLIRKRSPLRASRASFPDLRSQRLSEALCPSPPPTAPSTPSRSPSLRSQRLSGAPCLKPTSLPPPAKSTFRAATAPSAPPPSYKHANRQKLFAKAAAWPVPPCPDCAVFENEPDKEAFVIPSQAQLQSERLKLQQMAMTGIITERGKFRLYDIEEELDDSNHLWQQNVLKLYVYTNQHKMGATFPEGYSIVQQIPDEVAWSESILSGESYDKSESQA